MVDTVRTIADLLANYLNDNNAGEISPQDIRDLTVSLEALSPAVPLSATMSNEGIAGAGEYYMMGYYDCPAADTTLSNGSPTQAYGTANSAYAAHAILVSDGNASTNAPSNTIVVTVTGTRIQDDGTRTPGYVATITNDLVAMAADEVVETSEKFIGAVLYTATSAGATVFTGDINYGFASYEDYGNTDFTIDSFAFEWFAALSDAGFDIDIHRHELTGWTFSAAAFEAGSAPLYALTIDHGAEHEMVASEHGKWKRAGESEIILGSGSEGLVVHIVTTAGKSIEWLNGSIFIKPYIT